MHANKVTSVVTMLVFYNGASITGSLSRIVCCDHTDQWVHVHKVFLPTPFLLHSMWLWFYCFGTVSVGISRLLHTVCTCMCVYAKYVSNVCILYMLARKY